MSDTQYIDHLDTCYQLGARLYAAGIKEADLPFCYRQHGGSYIELKPGTPERKHLLAGWEQARHEAEDAPPED